MTPAAAHPWPWRTALVCLLVGLVWFGRNLDFNGHVHPDEPNKVRQILSGEYNFHHPLLMLDSVRLLAAAAGARDYDSIMLAGRRSSVLFVSLGVALLVLVSGRLYGTVVAAAAGIFLLTGPQLFELAHYFKEDPSLVFGLALALFAILLYGEKPDPRRAAFLGAAVAVAASAKYAGLMILPFAIYAVLAARRPRDLVLLGAVTAAGFMLINLPALLAAETWTRSIGYEVDRLSASGASQPRRVPHDAYIEFYWRTSPPLALLVGLHLYNVYRRRFRLQPVEWVMIVLPAAFLAVISSVPNVTQRYFLPAGVILACLGAAGLLVLLRFRHGKILAVLAAAVAVGWQAPKLWSYEQSFARDHQREVFGFLADELPAGAFVLVDDQHGLPEPPFAAPRLERRWIRPDDTLENLRAGGVTHVVVTQRRQRAVFDDERTVYGLDTAGVRQVRALYEDLFQRATLLRQWERGPNSYLQARFRIYELPAAP
jgi:hypothetical protein